VRRRPEAIRRLVEIGLKANRRAHNNLLLTERTNN
jgi:hypothetical protein